MIWCLVPDNGGRDKKDQLFPHLRLAVPEGFGGSLEGSDFRERGRSGPGFGGELDPPAAGLCAGGTGQIQKLKAAEFQLFVHVKVNVNVDFLD